MSGSVRKKFLSFDLRTTAAEQNILSMLGTFPLYEKKRKETHNSNFAMMHLEDNNAIK